MILQILEYGDPILRAKGKPIGNIDDRIRGCEHDRDDARGEWCRPRSAADR